MNAMLKPILTVGLIIAVVGGFLGTLRPVAAEVSGNTYTSPTYGYQITWPDNWFFSEEVSEFGVDVLFISNGLNFVQFLGGPAPGSPAAERDGIMATCGSDGVTSNCEPATRNGELYRGQDAVKAWGGACFDQDLGGFVGRFCNLVAVIDIGNGLSIAVIASVAIDSVPGFFTEWETVLAGVNAGSGPTPTPDASTLDTVSGGEGELAPVFVNDSWRLAIVSTGIGPAIPALELELKEGRDWLAVVADVTNWSEVDREFSLRDPLIQTLEMDEPWDIAPSSTRQVARLLGLEAQGNTAVSIAANSTERVVLVYSVPTPGSNTRLMFGDHSLLLDSTFDVAFDPATLPADATAPEVIRGTFIGVVADEGGEIKVEADGVELNASLIGVDLPGLVECHGLETYGQMAEYMLSDVMLEQDTAVSGDNLYYVWIVNPDGSVSSMNHDLLSSGAAKSTSIPTTARFAAWLQDAETTAEAAQVGLWGACGV